MSPEILLILILLVILLGTLPTWRHSRRWGYLPGGIVGVVLILLILLVVAGR